VASCPFADSVDRYGRRLAYVKVDVQNVALTLIHTGMAAAWRPGSEPQSTRYTDYRAAERAARPHTGLWATCETLGCEERDTQQSGAQHRPHPTRHAGLAGPANCDHGPRSANATATSGAIVATALGEDPVVP
jgi:hypothetical protein